MRTWSRASYGSTGWGDAICVIPLDALHDHYGDRDIVARSAAGHGEVERLRLVDQQRPDRAAADGLGRARLHLRRLAAAAWAASGRAKSPSAPSATTPRRRSTSTSHRELTARARRIAGDATLAQRMANARAAVKAAFADGVRHRRSGRIGLRRPDLLRAGHSSTTSSRPNRLAAASGLLQGGDRPRRTAASAPASSARPPCFRRWSRSASSILPRQSSSRSACPAGCTR